MPIDPFEMFYQGTYRTVDDSAYIPPARFRHGIPALVGTIPANGEGRTVTIYEARLPAAFFTLKVDSVGQQAGYTIETGSGMGDFAFQLARHIAEDMIVFESEEKGA